MKPPLKTTAGQPSWKFSNDRVSAFVTRTGGELAPVTFKLGRRSVQPFSIAPWAEEKSTMKPPMIPMMKALRGDFFCCPFGVNPGEKYLVHGETANRDWTLGDVTREGDATTLRASMQLNARPGRVDKRLTLRDGHTAVYCEHVLTGFSGPMPIGSHAMLKFPDQPGVGHISTSRFTRGHVVTSWEQAEAQGYSVLKNGATFTSLKRVPARTGGTLDVSRYPARRGYEELVEVVNEQKSDFGWSAVSLPTEGYVFFTIKDPRVLRQTIFWFSNGGRYYAPWHGRHVNVLGVEDVTSYFHLGLVESAKPNSINRTGSPTAMQLRPDRPLRVAHILALAAIPRDFDEVKSIVPHAGGVKLTARSGRQVVVPLDLGFVRK
ncbi:MAG: hypothetical protein KA257_01005 [Opitutaceae bacterium]|nr:hypothetical protein [Opitutaceae bacterium]MBP9913870.1 hypothetical protein [Opitutaceae bacterium]